MIISFIGPPGCGKSTQIEFVTKTFLQDVDVIMLRVPNLVKTSNYSSILKGRGSQDN